ncbi:MAG: hypothetical protein U5P41_14440 [Gammaproteobacteria bacterium]|nr:hypothetical protein [Gammaproteobacteria bacterium]
MKRPSAQAALKRARKSAERITLVDLTRDQTQCAACRRGEVNVGRIVPIRPTDAKLKNHEIWAWICEECDRGHQTPESRDRLLAAILDWYLCDIGNRNSPLVGFNG